MVAEIKLRKVHLVDGDRGIDAFEFTFEVTSDHGYAVVTIAEKTKGNLPDAERGAINKLRKLAAELVDVTKKVEP